MQQTPACMCLAKEVVCCPGARGLAPTYDAPGWQQHPGGCLFQLALHGADLGLELEPRKVRAIIRDDLCRGAVCEAAAVCAKKGGEGECCTLTYQLQPKGVLVDSCCRRRLLPLVPGRCRH